MPPSRNLVDGISLGLINPPCGVWRVKKKLLDHKILSVKDENWRVACGVRGIACGGWLEELFFFFSYISAKI